MKVSKTAVVAASGALLIAGLGAYVANWYYNEILWPRDIQTRIFGQEIVSHRDLVYRKGFSHLGQGAFRWEYRIDSSNQFIGALCKPRSTDSCDWTKSVSPAPHVTLDAVFLNGVLTLEESWE